MKLVTSPIVFYCSLLFVGIGNAAPDQLVNPALDKANLHGATSKLVPAKIDQIDVSEALRIQVDKQPQNQWDAQLSFPSTSAVEKGDVVTIAMWMRGAALKAADGSALVELDFEKYGAPYTKSIQFPAFLTEGWQKITAKCYSVESYDTGGSHVTLKLGFLAQWVELAAVEIINHGQKDVDFDALPSSPITYVGREMDATWRAEANARIEKHRKADLKIIVVDKHGNRAPNTKVRAVQTSHEFAFGTAIGVDAIMGKTEEDERFRKELAKYFNSVTHENGFKWKAWESNWPGALNTQASLLKLREMGLSVRGHVMVWPGWRNLPDQVKTLEDQPEVLRQRVLDHIRVVAGASRGYVTDWDVVNEIYDNPDLTRILGDEAPATWFKEARKHLPDTDLYYNDYAALVSAGLDTGHKRHFEKTVKGLIDGGAPIDGLGLQGHFGLLLTPPEMLIDELDRWAKFGLKLKVTEFDVVMEDEELQGDYTRDFLTAAFSHPSMEGVSVWGFWSKRHWRPNAAFLREDWSERPAGKAWRELVNETWHTDTEVTTDENGEATIRGFRGSYEIRTKGPVWKTELPAAGGIVTVGQW